MYREKLEELRAWRERKDRLPLIIRGARQVGKTWLVNEFGRLDFNDIAVFNFEKQESLKNIFEGDLEPSRLIRMLEISAGRKILPGNTLIFFDEIQEAPRALTSLKYFAEEAPEYAVIAAGSLLGIAEHQGVSFPVGKVSFMDLLPMSFNEFLIACGDSQLAALINEGDFQMIGAFAQRYEDRLREYMLVGGMPDAVRIWTESGDFNALRKRQEEIIESYLSDLSKHAPADIAVKGRQIILAIPSQLARENKKFIFSRVREGGRAREYENCLGWLKSCRIINAVKRVTSPSVPLKSYEEDSVFKLFLHDTGLLSALTRIDPAVIISGSEVYDMFKGALTEQYVLQELIASGWKSISYYSNDRSSAEIDFLLESGSDIVPLEVKSGINLRAKSLKAYHEKYSPRLSLRTSLAPFIDQGWLVNVPLYAVSALRKVCRDRLPAV